MASHGAATKRHHEAIAIEDNDAVGNHGSQATRRSGRLASKRQYETAPVLNKDSAAALGGASVPLGLLDLPAELHLLVCSFLPFRALQALSTANKILYRRTDPLFGPLLAKSGALPPIPKVFSAFRDKSRTWRGTVFELLALQLPICSDCKVYFDNAWECPRTFDDSYCRDCGVGARTKELDDNFDDEDMEILDDMAEDYIHLYGDNKFTCIDDVAEALEQRRKNYEQDRAEEEEDRLDEYWADYWRCKT